MQQRSCSCPDWSNPCKYSAAVYYLLGEEFDRDPFLIFKLQGIDREEFLELLGEKRPPATEAASAEQELLPDEPLSPSASLFWTGGPLPENLIGEAPTSSSTAVLPRRLGKFPFWQGREGFFEVLDSVYSSAALRAVQILNHLAFTENVVTNESPAK
jgi:uncharacterized Zn finger protein